MVAVAVGEVLVDGEGFAVPGIGGGGIAGVAGEVPEEGESPRMKLSRSTAHTRVGQCQSQPAQHFSGLWQAPAQGDPTGGDQSVRPRGLGVSGHLARLHHQGRHTAQQRVNPLGHAVALQSRSQRRQGRREGGRSDIVVPLVVGLPHPQQDFEHPLHLPGRTLAQQGRHSGSRVDLHIVQDRRDDEFPEPVRAQREQPFTRGERRKPGPKVRPRRRRHANAGHLLGDPFFFLDRARPSQSQHGDRVPQLLKSQRREAVRPASLLMFREPFQSRFDRARLSAEHVDVCDGQNIEGGQAELGPVRFPVCRVLRLGMLPEPLSCSAVQRPRRIRCQGRENLRSRDRPRHAVGLQPQCLEPTGEGASRARSADQQHAHWPQRVTGQAQGVELVGQDVCVALLGVIDDGKARQPRLGHRGGVGLQEARDPSRVVHAPAQLDAEPGLPGTAHALHDPYSKPILGPAPLGEVVQQSVTEVLVVHCRRLR